MIKKEITDCKKKRQEQEKGKRFTEVKKREHLGKRKRKRSGGSGAEK